MSFILVATYMHKHHMGIVSFCIFLWVSSFLCPSQFIALILQWCRQKKEEEKITGMSCTQFHSFLLIIIVYSFYTYASWQVVKLSLSLFIYFFKDGEILHKEFLWYEIVKAISAQVRLIKFSQKHFFDVINFLWEGDF